MSIPTSSNGAVAYIYDRPDFGLPINVGEQWLTPISTQRNGTEQRTQKRLEPRYTQRFTLSALDIAELAWRRAAELRESGRPICVPLWKYWFPFVSIAAGIVTITGDLSCSKFKVGGRLMIWENSSTWNFSKIIAKGTSTLTIDPGENFPAILAGFTSAARVYPCIVGVRPQNQAETTANRLDDSDAIVEVNEL